MSFLAFSQNSQSIYTTTQTISMLGFRSVKTVFHLPQTLCYERLLFISIQSPTCCDSHLQSLCGDKTGGCWCFKWHNTRDHIPRTGKSVWLQTGQECLFADIVYNSNVTHDYMFLEVNVEHCLDAGIGITVSLLLIFNPRRAQRGLVGWSVSLSVYICLLPRFLPPRATRQQKSGNKRAVSKVWWLFGADHFLSVCLSVVSLCVRLLRRFLPPRACSVRRGLHLIYDLFISW